MIRPLLLLVMASRRNLPPDVIAAWFDRSFLDAALAELGLAHVWTPLDRDGRAITQ